MRFLSFKPERLPQRGANAALLPRPGREGFLNDQKSRSAAVTSSDFRTSTSLANAWKISPFIAIASTAMMERARKHTIQLLRPLEECLRLQLQKSKQTKINVRLAVAVVVRTAAWRRILGRLPLRRAGAATTSLVRICFFCV